MGTLTNRVDRHRLGHGHEAIAGLPTDRATREKDGTLPKERVERDEEDLVRLYLTDIGQYPLLTKDDEVRLAQAIEAGNAARLELDAEGRALTPAELRSLADEAVRSERVVALSVADRAVFLEKGQVRFEGPAAELAERDDLARAVFLGREGG